MIEWISIHNQLFVPILVLILDTLIGDPQTKWHPVALIGRLIAWYESLFYHVDDKRWQHYFYGTMTVLATLGTVCLISVFILGLSGFINDWLYYVIEIIFVYVTISPRALTKAGLGIYKLLKRKQINRARQAVSMIVGRNTKELDEGEITRATIETIAENTIDGIVSPLLFFAVLGPLGAILYRTANTLDSMIAYRNERYMYFGWFAARLDDVLNFIPARIAGILFVIAAYLLPLDGKQAWRILRRDASKHPSPNGGYAEAPTAGALHIRLGGHNKYGETMTFRAYMGDAQQPLRGIHILRTSILMYTVTIEALIITILIKEIAVIL